MNQFDTEKSREYSRENSTELNKESRESKEGEPDPEMQVAAQKERADYLVKEVKSNQQQVQNIVLHITQVQQAIKKLRAELQLSEQGDSASVTQDKARIGVLKTQIGAYLSELTAMKEDLVVFEIEELRKTSGPSDEETLKQIAQDKVDKMLSILQE